MKDHPMPDALAFFVPAFPLSSILTRPFVCSLLSHSPLCRTYTRTRTYTHTYTASFLFFFLVFFFLSLFSRPSFTRTQLKGPANYRIVNKLDTFVEAT